MVELHDVTFLIRFVEIVFLRNKKRGGGGGWWESPLGDSSKWRAGFSGAHTAISALLDGTPR